MKYYLHKRGGSLVGSTDNIIINDLKTIKGVKNRISKMIPYYSKSIIDIYNMKDNFLSTYTPKL